jgi:hypothetical protein
MESVPLRLTPLWFGEDRWSKGTISLLSTGVVGGIAALLLSVAILTGKLPVDVHGVMAFVLVQTIWGGCVASLLIRGRL